MKSLTIILLAACFILGLVTFGAYQSNHKVNIADNSWKDEEYIKQHK